MEEALATEIYMLASNLTLRSKEIGLRPWETSRRKEKSKRYQI
jgi:hypothetical protein